MMFADRAGEIESEGVPTEITAIRKRFFFMLPRRLGVLFKPQTRT